MMSMGKSSLMNRVMNSPGTFKGKATMMSQSVAGSTMMGTTMDQTATLNATNMEAARSSPFKETISKGMITGVGFLNKQSLSSIKKVPN